MPPLCIRCRGAVGRDKPAAPAIRVRRLVIHIRIAAELGHHVPVVAHGVAAHNHAGHVERARRHVTGETTRPASEDRRSGRLVERVEHHPLLRIVGRELDCGSARDVADDDRLIEEDGARVLRADVGALHAGFREHQQLRFHRHAEGFQNGHQVAGSRIALEGSSALSEGRFSFATRSVAGRMASWMLGCSSRPPAHGCCFWPNVNAPLAIAMLSAAAITSSRPRTWNPPSTISSLHACGLQGCEHARVPEGHPAQPDAGRVVDGVGDRRDQRLADRLAGP